MKTLYLPVVAILLFALSMIMLQAGKQQQLAQMRQTYSICWAAHNEINGQSEQACGNAQDLTHTEFVCTTSNCWLEVK